MEKLADVSKKLNSVPSVFHLFLAILKKDVVLVEASPGASVCAPAAASSSWALGRIPCGWVVIWFTQTSGILQISYMEF